MFKSSFAFCSRTVVLLLFCAYGLWAEVMPLVGALPKDARLVELARIEVGSAVAVAPEGNRIAYVYQGLRIREVGSGVTRSILPGTASCLAWSDDGNLLAASLEQEEQSSVRLFDAQGNAKGDLKLPGRVSGLQWRADGTLLVMTVVLETFRFGTQMSQVLHRWDGRGSPLSQVLNSSTLMPKVANRLKATLPARLGFELSPLQDEILYYRLYSPPALNCHLRLVLHHLGSGQGHVLADVDLNASGACFDGTGEHILYGDGLQETRLSDPWSDEVLSRFPQEGLQVAMSPSSHRLLLDGRLYLDGRLAVTFPPGTRGYFAKKNGVLFLSHGSDIYQVTGLQEALMTPLSDTEASRIRELRKWLSEGLIAVHEYRLKKVKP
jgi:hypothetical protein